MITSQITTEANGRVNLIGEHTDYNGGWVLPTAIPQKTKVVTVPHEGRAVILETLLSIAGQTPTVTYTLGNECATGTWDDYIKGCTRLLEKRGFTLGGFKMTISSDVPAGSGLSSSAALLIAVLKALRAIFEIPLSDLELAQLAQQVENEFVGANVGIMDQMACSFASLGKAIFIDTKNLTYEGLVLPLDKMDLVVINSGVDHQHAGGDYNQRRSECEEACQILRIKELRELGMTDLNRLNELPNVLARRAQHVITENDRVHQFVACLKSGNIQKMGALFYESHASMRDDYEISVTAIDQLVELCRAHPATIGARLTGGGFGGSIVAITEKDKGREMAEAVTTAYKEKTGNRPTILVP